MADGKAGRPREVDRVDRARQIFELGLTGMSMADIADHLGRQVSECYRLQQLYIQKFLPPLAEEARKIELARLDRYLLSLEPLIQRHDVKAITEARMISQRRSELMGLNTPTQVEHKVRVVDAVDEEIMQLMAKVDAMPPVVEP